MSGRIPIRGYVVETLDRGHDRASFKCGVEALDRYLKTQARQDARRRIAAPFMLRGEDTKAIIGYYTLSATAIRLGQLPQTVAQRLPAYPLVPATLLGRLAVDQRLRGSGLGEHLLMDALHRSWVTSAAVASFAVLVDAKDEAAQTFYLRYDFIPFRSEKRRLYLPMQTLAKLFDA